MKNKKGHHFLFNKRETHRNLKLGMCIVKSIDDAPSYTAHGKQIKKRWERGDGEVEIGRQSRFSTPKKLIFIFSKKDYHVS